LNTLERLITFAKQLRPLEWAFVLSLIIHALVLSIHFRAAERMNRLIQNTDLPLTLVNIRLQSDPRQNAQAQALAQSTLNGGGDQSELMASSPLPSAPKNQSAPDHEELRSETQRLKALESQQNKLLAQVKAEVAELGLTQPEKFNPEQESRRQRLLALIAEIEARIELSHKEPRKRYFAPSTQQSAFALYYDVMRRKIEAQGTRHFPSMNGTKLYGALIMAVHVNTSGQILRVEVLEGSGQSELDKRAQAIVLSSGPFPPFGPELEGLADQLAMVSKYTFTPEGTSLSAQTK
jgi:protein TonB